MISLAISTTRIFTFDSAHFLPQHAGKCAAMHGHTYKLEVTVSRDNGKLISEGSDEGMVIDFSDLKDIVTTEVIDKMDHKILNEVFSFRTTAENIAMHIFGALTAKLQPRGVSVTKIKLWESPNSYVEVVQE